MDPIMKAHFSNTFILMKETWTANGNGIPLSSQISNPPEDANLLQIDIGGFFSFVMDCGLLGSIFIYPYCITNINVVFSPFQDNSLSFCQLRGLFEESCVCPHSTEHATASKPMVRNTIQTWSFLRRLIFFLSLSLS
jgi:hypothetical protein